MPMPSQLLDRLRELAQQEGLLRLAWGLARWVTLLVAMILLSCFIDWFIDIWYDTPQTVRWLMRIAMAVVAGWWFYRWIVAPLRTGLKPEELVFWVEEQQPAFGHRLISAIQLNAAQADRAGMSSSLIDALTAEAERTAGETSFQSLLDRRRWNWSLALLVPTFVVPLFCFLVSPATTLALLERAAGSNIDIPRSVTLTVATTKLWPRGEPVTLRFLAQGAFTIEQEGTVEIIPDGQSAETYLLKYQEAGPTAQQGYFTATIPASSTPFSYRAWLFDGRTREPGHVEFVPRPVLSSWEASLLLPRYVGLRPDQQAYELPQPKGDLKPVPASSARLQVTTPTPISHAEAELLGPIMPDLGARLPLPMTPISPSFLLEAQRQLGWTPAAAGPLFSLQRVPLTLQPDGLGAAAIINLPAAASAYRIIVTDQYGLTNRPIPRRAITFHADELPQVTLLPERFAGANDGPEEIDLDGMPVPLGKTIRIGYLVRDDLALDSVSLRYRINEGPWEQLPLTELKAAPAQARFDERTGAFDKSSTKDQVAYYAVPPRDPNTQLGRSLGGGRFDFQTRSLPNLKLGDVIDYYIEAKDRHDDPLRPPGRSVVKRKNVVTEAQFIEWLVHTVQQENRLRQVERQQRKVFEPK